MAVRQDMQLSWLIAVAVPVLLTAVGPSGWCRCSRRCRSSSVS
jgi:hypothetical protein